MKNENAKADEHATLPRGLRNNNPLNIRYSAENNWLGQTGTDGEYAVFVEAKHGLRAAAKLLNRYYSAYGLYTVSLIISRWAPAVENNTASYIDHVSKKLNVSEHQVLLWPTDLNSLIRAMVQHENGQQPFTTAEINEAIKMAAIS